MPILDSQVTTFMSLFSGSEQGYGVHEYTEAIDANGKKQGKSFTEKTPPMPEHYADHLQGRRGLGIIPVKEGKTKFCEIDIDVYGSDVDVFVKAIWRNSMPLVPFRSKSGGLHLCTFYSDFIDADIAISNARRLAALLSVDKFIAQHNDRRVGAVEVFPKQKQVPTGSLGNWINLPYYGGDEGTQQALGHDCLPMRFDDFLVHAQSHLQTTDSMAFFFENLPYNDAPPCLQTIYLMDAMDTVDGRNNYLHCFGTYFKKADNEFWEAKVYEVNRAMGRPLDEEELENTVINSLRKKDYNYMCTQMPCVAYCNKGVCKTREYGVGKDLGHFSTLDYGRLIQYKMEQPYYEWEIRDQGQKQWTMMRFRDESEIIGQDKFLQLCMRYLHVLPPKLKNSAWSQIVSQSLKELEVVTITDDYDMSPFLVFKTLLHEFVTGNTAKNPEQIVSMGRVWFDGTSYLFRSADVLKYVRYKKNFTAYRESDYPARLQDLGAVPSRTRVMVKGNLKQISVWMLHHDAFVKNIEESIGEYDVDNPRIDVPDDYVDEEAF